ncbi:MULTISPECIES: hypothetical protein [Xanthomonas]|uniref:hypothetical protein n=1 Tax=Xanthomonas TaxID=338 RepID=UPI001C2C58A7|nr:MULTISPECIES: hypothetical protein [Xanthomonas]QXF03563.1 hypothetical protein KJA71_08945 [Xanthomonas citri pv. citri]QXO96815.1 hypothetical protein IG630_23995 [Xanthomonas sp. WG16]
MRERPILFNGAMVRAILSGTKSQTRRVVKGMALDWLDNAKFTPQYVADPRNDMCPFGKIGDRLWVKETTVRVEEHGYIGPVHAASDEGQACLDGGLAPAPDDMTEVEPWEIKLRPSIHMPRSMCRLVLEITDVRVERLHAISEADALAEGVDHVAVDLARVTGVDCAARVLFRDIWTSTGGDWGANPWVWVICFRRAEQ